MLVLSRRVNERLVIPCIEATIQVVAAKPGVVRLGIEAPPQVEVYREEVYQARRERGLPDAATANARLDQLRQLVRGRLTGIGLGLALVRRCSRVGTNEGVEAAAEKVERDFLSFCQQVRAVLGEDGDELDEPLTADPQSA